MATLYNAVSKNNASKTQKIYTTISDLLYIHDAGGFDLNGSTQISFENYPNYPNKNRYTYIMEGCNKYNYLTTTSDIPSSESNLFIESNTTKKLHRLRRTLPYVKDLSNYTASTFYFNKKYYTPYVIHIGLVPVSTCINANYADYYPNKCSWSEGTYAGTYAYLPNISLYTDMYNGVTGANTDTSLTESQYDMTQYSPSFHLVGNQKYNSQWSYSYYLGSYFYPYVWNGTSVSEATNHYTSPRQQCVRPGWSVFSRGLSTIRMTGDHITTDMSVASAISYIDLVVEFNSNYIYNILNSSTGMPFTTNFSEYVYARYHDDNYDNSGNYSNSDVANNFYFRFTRYGSMNSSAKYWDPLQEDMDWGIFIKNSGQVLALNHTNNYNIQWGADDSNLHILHQFYDFLTSECNSYFSASLGPEFIDIDKYYTDNSLVIKSVYSENFNATIKALHINVVNNTSYINSYNSCSIVENSYQYWYARIGAAFSPNMINIYVNNGLINQGKTWGWNTTTAALNAWSKIKIYNGPISQNGGNKPLYGENVDADNEKWIYPASSSNVITNHCQHLQYLQSTGTQFIDTGIVPDTKTHIYIEFTPGTINSNNPTISNVYNEYVCGSVVTYTRTWAIGSSNVIYAVNGSPGTATNIKKSSITADTSKRYWAEIYYRGSVIYFKCGIVGETRPSSEITFGTSISNVLYGIRLFGTRYNTTPSNLQSKWSGKIYCCKIWTYDELVRDMIPVAYKPSSTNIYCMYDRVSRTIFDNIGTGSFTGGPSAEYIVLWIDDFDSNRDNWAQGAYGLNWEEYVEQILIPNGVDYNGANPYYYTGETFEWNGSIYYLWEMCTDLSAGHIAIDDVYYILTDTIDFTTLYQRSIAYDYTNSGGIVCRLSHDLTTYDINTGDLSDQTIITVQYMNSMPS